MSKKLWCVSIKHEDDISETIKLVRTDDSSKAVELATNDYVENSGFYQGDFESFEQDCESGVVETYSFEVKDEDILEEK